MKRLIPKFKFKWLDSFLKFTKFPWKIKCPWIFYGDFTAITLKFVIFYKKDLPNWLTKHEMAHYYQQKKLGFGRFLYRYLKEFFVNFKRLWPLQKEEKFIKRIAETWFLAYWNISFEEEARKVQFLEDKES
jgi:hypothetical protein